jgi:butyryl-CoA dehydrogenase
MDFEITEEQKILQATIRDFAQNELAPVADEYDQAEEFPFNNFKRMAELGLTGMILPPEYGGSGSDEISMTIVMEEIAKACASTADILNTHMVIGSNPIARYGTEEQKEKFLPPLVKGERISCFAVTEPSAGSDIGSLRTKAIRDGDYYIINGQKTFITAGDVCDNAILFANIPDLAPRGMTAFILEKELPGFSRGKKFKKLGMRAGTNCELFFEDCRMPVANRLGQEGQGMKIALSTLDHGRIPIAGQAVGIAQAVLEKCVEYSKTREQFGVPICNNQAIAWKIADMATEIEAARFLVYHAAYLAMKGKPYTKNAAMAKLYASELESPMQRYFRDAKLTEIYEGTSEIQRIVISRAVLA